MKSSPGQSVSIATAFRHWGRQTLKRILDGVLPSRAFLCSGDRRSRNIALTFDDGPDTERTPEIGDVLAGHGVSATFFVLGKQVVPETESILKRLVEAGHEIACHRFTHRRLRELDSVAFRDELRQWKETCGRFCQAVRESRRIPFRPPFGEVSAGTLLAAWRSGFGVVLWSLESEDWRGRSVEELATRVHPDKVRGGEIMVFHDTCSQTPEALSIILPRLKDAGFEFVTISEMIERSRNVGEDNSPQRRRVR